MVKSPLAIIAALMTVTAVPLAMRSQPFTRVMVDGLETRMHVRGSGVTVVFENGGAAPLEMWGKVQPAVSRFARTVSYDRSAVPGQLHRALEAANIPPPYIVVGASLGGRQARAFAERHPTEVTGMVLVDPTPDADQAGALPSGIPITIIDAIAPETIPFASRSMRDTLARRRPIIEAESEGYRRSLEGHPLGQIVTTHLSGHNVALEQPDLVIRTIREMVMLTPPR